jgi:hypothetical protein
MPLDVNGYNEDFKAFLEFASGRIATDKSAVAGIGEGPAQYGRARPIVAIDPQIDKVGKLRTQDQRDANEAVRTAFRNAVVDMFGGESRIPDSVKDAMILKDYGKGKPLTARRIMAVKAAIDADGSVKLNAFKSADGPRFALDRGWRESELATLGRAARFLSEATGVDEFAAIQELSTPGSKANRLMNYGGRFLDSAANFANGLRLIDGFAEWFTDVVDTMKPIHAQKSENRDFTPADTPTKLNFYHAMLDKANLKGMEKFAFEELATNPKADLSGTDMEKLFGFENNKAMYCLGTGHGGSVYSSLANVPKEKRSVVFAALNAFTVPARNAREAKGPANSLHTGNVPIVTARILRHFDKAEALFNAGKLTAKNIVKELFAEIPDKGDYDHKTIDDHFHGITEELNLEDVEGGKYTDVSSSAWLAMENSGCTFEETVQMLRAGEMPPSPKYLSTGTMSLKDFNGTVTGGRSLIGGDLDRPDRCYRFTTDLESPLLSAEQQPGFGFQFPGEVKFHTWGKDEGRANIQRVGDKVEALCGKVHVAQANAVMTMLSQSGLSNLRSGLPQIGATSNEHAPVDYTLTKDDRTGNVTIKYASPEALPFKFEWTATVDLQGNVTTTPMKVEKKPLSAELVAGAIGNASARMKVDLSDAQKANAAKLVGDLAFEHNLVGKKLDLFTNYVVRLALDDDSAEGDRKVAADMAKLIAGWQPIAKERDRATSVENVFKENFNDQIADALDDANAPAPKNFGNSGPEVHDQLGTDANRGVFTINGQVFDHQPADKLVKAFEEAVPGKANRQGLSAILNQSIPNAMSALSNRMPLFSTGKHPDGHVTENLPGIEKIVSRKIDGETFMTPIMTDRNDDPICYDLTVSKDGKSATVSSHTKAPLTMGAGPDAMATFGTTEWKVEFNINLSGAKPVITSCKITQRFDPA